MYANVVTSSKLIYVNKSSIINTSDVLSVKGILITRHHLNNIERGKHYEKGTERGNEVNLRRQCIRWRICIPGSDV